MKLKDLWFRTSIAYFYRRSLHTRAQKAKLRKAKKVIRQRRRIGRINNGR